MLNPDGMLKNPLGREIIVPDENSLELAAGLLLPLFPALPRMSLLALLRTMEVEGSLEYPYNSPPKVPIEMKTSPFLVTGV